MKAPSQGLNKLCLNILWNSRANVRSFELRTMTAPMDCSLILVSSSRIDKTDIHIKKMSQPGLSVFPTKLGKIEKPLQTCTCTSKTLRAPTTLSDPFGA